LGQIKDLTGQVFGELTVHKFHSLDKHGKSLWTVACTCGLSKVVRAAELLKGDTKSCGCFRKRVTSSTKRTHGQRRTKLYMTWLGMKQRCSNPKHRSFKNYGGRGIRVCKQWSESFQAFLQDMGPKPSNEHSLDRIDPDGSYGPGNCRWATIVDQNLNQRRYKRIQTEAS
jgi:hypothetical protein